MSTIKLDDVMNALRSVKDVETQKDIASLGMVKDLKVQGTTVSLRVVLKNASANLRNQIEREVRAALESAGAKAVDLKMDLQVLAKGPVKMDARGIPGIKHIIAVSSGKGGVGKSTVATNLAVSLGKLGFAVGLLDTDVYGPNIPTMVGIDATPMARQDDVRGEVILPLEAHGIKVMSMGLLVRGDQPLVWRGPMLHSVVNQFLNQVDWGNLDYLVIDMPPGTGDVQLSLTQLVPVSGAVLVTTPQEVSQQDVRKAILMFEKVRVPVLGIVENMSYFICDSCSKEHEIFGKGGGALLAEKYNTQLLGRLPLAQEVCAAGDSGRPISQSDPQGIQSQEFLKIAKAVSNEVSVASIQSGTQSGNAGVEIQGF